jgi:hypothetical protein
MQIYKCKLAMCLFIMGYTTGDLAHRLINSLPFVDRYICLNN